MKTFVKPLIFVAFIGLVLACEKDDVIVEELPNAALKRAQAHKVTVPFEANLLGELVSFETADVACADEGYYGRVILEVNGTATHMGKVSCTFNFCAIGPDDPDVPGADNKYAGSSTVLVAANGDKLFLDLEGGTVILGRTDDHPEYVVDYFRDIVTITGGTGRFDGASGELQMDDFDTNIDEYSHHHWIGEITLVKGKR